MGEHQRLQEVGYEEESYPTSREFTERNQLRRSEALQVRSVDRSQRGQRDHGRPRWR